MTTISNKINDRVFVGRSVGFVSSIESHPSNPNRPTKCCPFLRLTDNRFDFSTNRVHRYVLKLQRIGIEIKTSNNYGFFRFIKKVGWDEKLVNESYSWVENRIVHRPKLADWQKAFTDSLLDVGISPFNGFTYDHLYGTKVGGTIFDRFGRRHTTAELLASGNPDKLTVLVHATVQRLIFDTTDGSFASFSYIQHLREFCFCLFVP